MRLGLILAAGAATRNPNKLLLPMPHDFDVPCYEQVIQFARFSAGVSDYCLVLRKDSEVDLRIKSRTLRDNIVYQPVGSNNVVSAIVCGLSALDKRKLLAQCADVLILFGDNAYDAREKLPRNCPATKALASVRELPAKQAVPLDWWDGSTWKRGKERGGRKAPSGSSVASGDEAGKEPGDVRGRKSGGERGQRKRITKLERVCFAGWLLLGSLGTEKVLLAFSKGGEYAGAIGGWDMVQLLNWLHAQPVSMDNALFWHDVGTPEGYCEYLRDCIARRNNG